MSAPTADPAPHPRHPLDPLSADELRATAAVLRRDGGVGPAWRFASMELEEPAKEVAAAHAPGDPIARRALVSLWQREEEAAYEAVVDLTGDRLASLEVVPGVQPNFTHDEFHDVDAALRVEPRVIAALEARGVTDLDLVLFDLWTYGDFLVPEHLKARRVGWCDVWLRATPDGNPYANHLSGLHPIVDVSTNELLELQETENPIPRAPTMGEYVPRLVPGLEPRTDLKPVEITQPQGISFALDGNELTWQGWRMRLGFNHREGLVIHQLSYEDGGERRQIAARMSFAEMIVPYRDPSPDHERRTAYDVGEWGLGFMTTSLELGCDCLGEIRYLDAVLHDTAGEPWEIRNAICLHEEDDGLVWKHVDERTGTETRRQRRMVVSFHATVANYEYLVYWRFYLDGNVECEVRATGIMVTTPLPEGASAPAHGTLVDERTYAPLHQHFIVARLDMDVDGTANTVVEVDSEPGRPSAEDPYGLAVRTVQTPVRSEAEAGRDQCWERQRSWKVQSATRTNRLGQPTAYKLSPTATVPSMLHPESPLLARAEVLRHQLWVTRHHAEERWPCGTYPVQSREDLGLPVWTRDDEPLEGEDVVLWYVFGIHHVTRVEDWPVMPVDTVSFWLKPFGFFDRNPALDVPASEHGGHGEHCAHHG